ncbi:21882_t:CDS:10 [Entrophospora sp. SA101]|nr:21882_t:CDS:10 [Entrophospora sp. SA101]
MNILFMKVQPPCSPTKKRKANKCGPKSDEIWNYYNKGQEKNDGHYSATCYYCSKTWARGKPAKLKAHLANKCLPCPPDISKFWKDTLATEVVNYSRSKKNPTTPLPGIQPYITDHFGSKKPLPLFVTERIDHALLKAWVIAGIPFEVIENPFVIDLFKELNPGYTPPSRTTLSGQLLDQEVARVNLNIEKELESSNNLTLTLDGWTSRRNESLYNYIISTPSRKEYLIALKNYSGFSHTGNFLADEISDIVEQIGLDKFAAIVTDAAPACCVVREKTEESSDLVKIDDIKEFITKWLQTWVKTRWGSLYMTTDSILCAVPVFDWIIAENRDVISNDEVLFLLQNEDCFKLLPVFDWIIAENRDVISNDEVLFLLQNEDFLTKCCHIHSVWGPIKECINILESNTATLADCFIYMIKLAVAIFKLPDSNQFKTSAIHIFNNRYIEFQHPAYLLCYYIHPLYREAALVAVKLWKNLNHSEQETKLSPYDLPYVEEMDTPELWWGSIKNKPSHLSEIAIRLFGITPTQSNSELLYYDKTSTSNELRNVANDSSVGALMSLESENDYLNNVNLNDNSIQTRNTLIIDDIIDFNFFNNNNEVNENETNLDNSYNLDYDPELLVNNFLENDDNNIDN